MTSSKDISHYGGYTLGPRTFWWSHESHSIVAPGFGFGLLFFGSPSIFLLCGAIRDTNASLLFWIHRLYICVIIKQDYDIKSSRLFLYRNRSFDDLVSNVGLIWPFNAIP